MWRSPLDPATRRSRKVAWWCYPLHLWTLFGIALSNLILAVGLAVTPWALERGDFDRRLRPVLLPLAVYTALLGLAVLLSYDPGTSFSELGELTSIFGLFLGLIFVRGERQVRFVVDGLIIAATVLAALGLGQYLVGFGDLDLRIRGPFSHYMTLSGVLLVADLLLITQLFVGVATGRRWRWVALVILNVALLATLTRSAWVGLLVALLTLVLVRAPRYLLAAVPAALIWIVLAPVPLVHRASSILDVRELSNYDRLCMVEAGLHMVRERPLSGIGPEMVGERYPIYKHPTAVRPWVEHLHNTYVQIAAERGLPALGAYLWLIAAGALAAVRGYRAEVRGGGPRQDLYLGAALALLAFSIAGIFEYNWGDTEVQRVAMLALAIPFCLRAAEPRPAHAQGQGARAEEAQAA